MAKEESVLMSKLAYAKYLGINEKSVRNAVAAGKIIKGWDVSKQKIKVKEADEEFGHLHQVATAKPGISKGKRVEKMCREPKIPNPEKKQPKAKAENTDKKNSDKSELDPATGHSFDHSQDFIDDTQNEFGDTYEELLLKIPVTSDLPYNEAVRRREIIQLALEKKKLEEMETVLVRRDTVEKLLYASASNLKKNLMMVGRRIADDILIVSNKVEVINIINAEITSILKEYASVEDIDLTVKSR